MTSASNPAPISTSVSVEQATQALRSVLDPETGRDLVTEGLGSQGAGRVGRGG